MTDKLTDYRRADQPLPDHNEVWPLYGAGFDNLGLNEHTIDVPLPDIGADQLLVRHDACGICFSDVKILKLGPEHPRIYRNMQASPVVMGHEVAMTVVKIGENLRDKYKVGDRFTIQADIYINGKGFAYGYEIEGGFSKYGVIDERVLNGDEGNYLLPVQTKTGVVESALVEPWACVVAAYRLEYRTKIKPGGTTWIIGTGEQDTRAYSISEGFNEASHPEHLLLSRVPAEFAHWLRTQASTLGIEVSEVTDLANPPVDKVDDIIMLGSDPDALEVASPKLADGGVFAIIADQPMPRRANIDIGRVHYNRWVYVGGSDTDIALAYKRKPVRSTLQPGGRAWFVGAAGPMGRMHVQRAIEIPDAPKTIICSDVSDHRLEDLRQTFEADAKAKGIEFVCLNPTNADAAQALAQHQAAGFDDIIVLAPVPKVISDVSQYLKQDGTLNIFAGVARGTMTDMDVSDVYLKGTRWIGQSGSTIADMRSTLDQAESGTLSPNRAAAAVGSLSAFRDGLRAVQDAVYPGKVVIFPHIKELPLTALPDLKDTMPTVYEKLADGREWTKEAEEEFFRLMLP
ncbi:MAG: alcohol dehydrogenase catalytic domain-containing protein [Chloroflexota bacterium]|nr:alcohol dehydrogenase catalytic domain-containing protein [Chloroflexota bacterium]